MRFQLSSVIDIAETTFLPLGTSRPGYADPPLVYVMVELYNRDEVGHRFRAISSATLRKHDRRHTRAYCSKLSVLSQT